MHIVAVDAHTGLGIGLVLTALGFGFRHGIDWDHLAALTDITGSQERARRSMVLATLYAFGHALVVFVLGVLAILVSAEVPGWLDTAMERVVGVTLLALGTYVVFSLARHGRDFRMRSRWMLLFAGVRRLGDRLRGPRAGGVEPIVITHEHDHVDDGSHGHVHAETPVPVRAFASAGLALEPTARPHVHRQFHRQVHRHFHHHMATMPADPFPAYGRATAFGVGMLHGIGAETPTQVVVFAAAAGAGGAAAGVLVLAVFLLGLVASNTVVALAATFGFLGAARNFRVYAAISIVTAVFSLLLGTLLVLGRSAALPAILGG